MLTAKALYSLNGPSSQSISILVDGDESEDRAAEILERFHLIMVRNIAKKPTHQYEWKDMSNYFLSALNIMEIEYKIISKTDGLNISNHYTLSEDGEFIIHDLTKKHRDERFTSYACFLCNIEFQRNRSNQGIMSVPTPNTLRLLETDIIEGFREQTKNPLIMYLSTNDVKCIKAGWYSFIEASGDVKEYQSLIAIIETCLQRQLDKFAEIDEINRLMKASQSA